jgi:hypothetical protein
MEVRRTPPSSATESGPGNRPSTALSVNSATSRHSNANIWPKPTARIGVRTARRPSPTAVITVTATPA